MKVLFVTQWFHPEPGPRVHELAAELVRRGHEVTVLTGYPSYPIGRFYEGWRPRLFSRHEHEGVKVIRLAHFPHAQRSVVRRILNYASFMLSVMTVGNLLVRRADCMYVLLPPPTMGFAAYALSLFHGIPFMYDILDIWPDAAVATGLVRSKALIAAIRTVEKLVYPLASAMSVPSEGYRANLAAKGVPFGKVSVIRQWEDEAFYRPLPRDEGFAQRHHIEGGFNVTYAGNVGFAQALATVVEAARLLAGEPEIRLVIAGHGAQLESLQRRCRELALRNVSFIGHLPGQDMPSLFSVSDLLLVHLKRDPVFRITIPRKTQSYMACGKPVLMAVEGEGAELIRATGSGVSCPSEDPAAMAQAIVAVYKMPPAARRGMGDNARKAFLDNFRKDDAITKYEELLKRISRR